MKRLEKHKLSEDLQKRNAWIRSAYLKIIEDTKRLLKNLATPELKNFIEVDREEHQRNQHEVYEFLTPYLYLYLQANSKGHFRVLYAINDDAIRHLGQVHYNQVLRIIFRATISFDQPEYENCLEVLPYYSDIYEEALERELN